MHTLNSHFLPRYAHFTETFHSVLNNKCVISTAHPPSPRTKKLLFPSRARVVEMGLDYYDICATTVKKIQRYEEHDIILAM